jgi:S-adenosylmethionine/arginine decarboxylase-like enzyme
MLQDVFTTDVTVFTKPEQFISDTVTPFGQSLHVDLYGVSTALCDDLSFCYQLLDDLTQFLHMHKQSPPFIFRSPEDQFPEKAGLSGWVPLIESGISIHTLTVTGFVSIDVYTCGDLDKEKTIQFLCDRLQTHSYESQHLIRGTKYYGECV